MSCGDVLLACVAVLFPPIAVWVKSGLCSADSILNILLCMLGYIPGLIHAWYIIAKNPEHDYDTIHDPERQDRVTYYYISHEPAGRRGHGHQHQHQQHQHHQHQHHHVHGPNYGSFPGVQGYKPPHQPQYSAPLGLPPSGNQQQQQSGVVRTQNPSNAADAGSSSAGPPPSYSEAVRGDHKIQSHD